MMLAAVVLPIFLDRTSRANALLKGNVDGIKCTRKVAKCMTRCHRRTHLGTIGLSLNLVCI
ncbi:hypothetical protein PF005_g17670 [Phytophthora fragariae]|uniref:Uncharacterized protein n=1 Tax=Phytophthora fragariae TaxID=53985 RepID=A0A6A3X0S4_9STRA|nr:hypothetical protein PF009_g18869 [Phytophthora fragariae]KAE9094503.1 hypothetical protein PF007_g17734 [Phytophthora fragariae]KAE9126497.1 hypothetical protein PF006_g16714 [Phytophthora fragariae]KAE9194477.1 hypothetical protein PF005_g17670 [Phytophthora fragariae]KAE9296221.1 hypothetical protein PF001_g16959 [Phytophthora fragariae]